MEQDLASVCVRQISVHTVGDVLPMQCEPSWLCRGSVLHFRGKWAYGAGGNVGVTADRSNMTMNVLEQRWDGCTFDAFGSKCACGLQG